MAEALRPPKISNSGVPHDSIIAEPGIPNGISARSLNLKRFSAPEFVNGDPQAEGLQFPEIGKVKNRTLAAALNENAVLESLELNFSGAAIGIMETQRTTWMLSKRTLSTQMS